MLPRRFTLSKSDGINTILKKGDSVKSRLLVGRYKKNDKGHHRFSVIVSHKISKKAVERNRIRRQIHEIIRLNLEKLPQNTHFDLLILPKTAIIGKTYDQIEENFLHLIPNLR